MKFLIAFVVIAVVSADPELDAMEKAATDVLARIHTHMGGKGGDAFSNFLSNGEFLRDAADQLNKTRRDRIEEGVGSKGATVVSVRRGKKEVKVTTVYGVGAGAVVNLRERSRTDIADVEPSVQELDEITQPLYEKYVNEFETIDASDATVVRIGDEARRELNLRDRREDLQARARGGYRVGARTTVSRSG